MYLCSSSNFRSKEEAVGALKRWGFQQIRGNFVSDHLPYTGKKAIVRDEADRCVVDIVQTVPVQHGQSPYQMPEGQDGL